MNKQQTTHTLQRLAQLLAPQWGRLIGLVVLTVAQVGLALYLPVLIGRILDQLGDTTAVGQLLSQALVVVLMTAIWQWIGPLVQQKLVYRLIQQMRQTAMMKLQKAQLSLVDGYTLGDLVARLTTDLDQLGDGILMVFNQFLSGILTIIVTIWMMWRMDGLMLAVVIGLTPLSLFLARYVAQKTYALFQAQAQTRSAQTEFVEESVRQMTLLQQLAANQASDEQFTQCNRAYTQASLWATFYSSTVNPLTRFINALIYAILLGIGIWRVGAHGLTLGGLVVFLSYATQYTKPFNDISSVLAELQGALVCGARLLVLMDLPLENETGTNQLVANEIQGGVSFQHIDFQYEVGKPLVKDFNITIASGSKVAIVGPTGAGKSTMMNLLMRFYEPSEGQILIDGQPVTAYTRASWREMLGMVPQEAWILSDTVHQNIAYSQPDATREAVIKAAKAARADYFIQQLPHGYDTVLAQAGASLSQGQQQLLTLARIFLKPPKVLILDEATSAIDAYTEQMVQAAFDELMAGRTSFVIAHRLSTIRSADLILVMNQGDIVEQGTHEELMAQSGVYYQMQQNMKVD